MARYATNVTVCLDNEEAAIRLLSEHPTATSSSHIERFHQLAETWSHRELSLNSHQGQVSIRWCPSHSGIAGNETADNLAKAACKDSSPNLPMTIARAKRKIRENYETLIIDYWKENAPARYKELLIGPNSKITKELSNLSRRSLAYILAARSGHGDFADYHRRFNHDAALLTCSFGREKSPEHFLYCRLSHVNALLQGCPPKRSERISWVLGTSAGAISFDKWSKSSAFFAKNPANKLETAISS